MCKKKGKKRGLREKRGKSIEQEDEYVGFKAINKCVFILDLFLLAHFSHSSLPHLAESEDKGAGKLGLLVRLHIENRHCGGVPGMDIQHAL